MEGYGNTPQWWVDWNQRAQDASERQYQDTLSESRAEREARLTIANNQLKNDRERNAISKGAMEADRIYKEGQIEILRQEAALNRDKFVFSQEMGRGELQLGRDKLGAETGLGLLTLRSQLRGPADWAQYLDLGEGMTSLQPSSGFLTAIAGGQRPPGMDMAFGGQPTAASLQNLAGNTGEAQAARLKADMALANQIAGNVGKVQPGTLEGLSPDRLDYLTGLWGAGGHSGRTLLDAANKAGIGQGSVWSV